MIIGLVIVFGAVVGLICFYIKGSGLGLVWDIMFGIAGYVITSSIMTGAYVINSLGKENIIGFNWYSMGIGISGSVIMILGAWLYNRPNPISKIGFMLVTIK